MSTARQEGKGNSCYEGCSSSNLPKTVGIRSAGDEVMMRQTLKVLEYYIPGFKH